MSGGEGAGWGLVLAAIAATYLWRFLGVALTRHIDPDGAAFRWVSAVAYAMLAGLVARLLLLPSGALAETALWIRLAATAIAFAAFFLAGRNLPLGLAAGVGTFMLLAALPH